MDYGSAASSRSCSPFRWGRRLRPRSMNIRQRPAKSSARYIFKVEIERRGAAAWLALAESRKTDALALMRSAAELEDGTGAEGVSSHAHQGAQPVSRRLRRRARRRAGRRRNDRKDVLRSASENLRAGRPAGPPRVERSEEPPLGFGTSWRRPSGLRTQG